MSAVKKHILVVDDEQDVRNILVRAFEIKGYRVSAAEAGHEALRLVKLDPPDLLIADLQMEDSDGLELIEEIKAAYPDLPVILLTGMVFDAGVIRDTINKKVSAYLDKTCSLQRLTQEVQRLLGELNRATVTAVSEGN
jgi:CheY-like chemotaxis protein